MILLNDTICIEINDFIPFESIFLIVHNFPNSKVSNFWDYFLEMFAKEIKSLLPILGNWKLSVHPVLQKNLWRKNFEIYFSLDTEFKL